MKYGDIIIIAGLVDPNGVNPKDRGCIVITRDELIRAATVLDVVAISTRFPEPLNDWHIPLPGIQEVTPGRVYESDALPFANGKRQLLSTRS